MDGCMQQRRRLAPVDAQEGERAHELVGHDLEGERREGLAVVGAPRERLVRRVHLAALHRRHVQGRGQVRHHRVQQRLHALLASQVKRVIASSLLTTTTGVKSTYAAARLWSSAMTE